MDLATALSLGRGGASLSATAPSRAKRAAPRTARPRRCDRSGGHSGYAPDFCRPDQPRGRLPPSGPADMRRFLRSSDGRASLGRGGARGGSGPAYGDATEVGDIPAMPPTSVARTNLAGAYRRPGPQTCAGFCGVPTAVRARAAAEHAAEAGLLTATRPKWGTFRLCPGLLSPVDHRHRDPLQSLGAAQQLPPGRAPGPRGCARGITLLSSLRVIGPRR
jgi:hypothetical protein